MLASLTRPTPAPAPTRPLLRFLALAGAAAISLLAHLPGTAADDPAPIVEGGAPNALPEDPGPLVAPQSLSEILARVLTGDLPMLDGNVNEPTIAVSPTNPLNIAVASATGLRVSVNGGMSFLPLVAPAYPAGYGNAGDPSIAFDSQGRLFWTYLGRLMGNIDLFISQCNPATGAILGGYPVNITASPGVNLPTRGHDKQWIAADCNVGSPFQDRLHVSWTEFVGGGTRVLSTFSTDQGANWSAAVVLSVGGEGFVWPVHNTVAPNGNVYVAYHSMYSTGAIGQIIVCRSTDGGVSFPQKSTAYAAGQADVTINVQGAVPGLTPSVPIPNTRFWLQGNLQPWILADPNTAGRIYVVASDDPDNNHGMGDAANVYIAISANNGVGWGAPARIDGGTGTSFQVMPTAAIDKQTGCIVVQYYDNRRGLTNGAGNFLLDVFATSSVNAGVTFGTDVRINDVAFDPDPGAPCRWGTGTAACPGSPPITTRIGEYNGIATADGRALLVWCGNTVGGGGVPTGQQTIFDVWSFDGTPPALSCPASIGVECTQTGGTPATHPDIVAFLGGASATDDCDSSPTLSNNAPLFFPHGMTTVTFTATDDAGNVATCNRTVNVVDTQPPTITCPAPITVECTAPGGTPANDPQLAPFFAGASASDVCDATPTLSNNAPGFFPLGTTPVAFTATDDDNNAASCPTSVTVLDRTPPVITVTLNRYVLWPPNHKLADIHAAVMVTDICDPSPTFVLTSVTSNEPEDGLGDGDTAPDIVGTAIGTPDVDFQLRSERSGTGPSRKYTIVYTASDHSGNASQATVCVRVPHDQSAMAVAGPGFNPQTVQFDPDAKAAVFVIPSIPLPSEDGSGSDLQQHRPRAGCRPHPMLEFDAALVQPSQVLLGHVGGAVAPMWTRLDDLDGDGYLDLAAAFRITAVEPLMAMPADEFGPVGIHFTTCDGLDYLVPSIAGMASAGPAAWAALSQPSAGGDAVGSGTQGDAGPTVEGKPESAAVQAGVTRLAAVFPNPFGASATILLETARAGDVEVAVYDLLGARVRTLASGESAAGMLRLVWDGANDAGRRVAPGLYLVRLSTASRQQTAKLMMLR